MSVAGRWAVWRARGPEQLAVTLGMFLAGFFLLPSGKALNTVYYALVLAPALFLLRGADWRWLAGSNLWRLAMLLLTYLTLSGLWSAGFTFDDWLHEAKGLPYLAVYLAVLVCVCVRRPAAWERLLRAVVLAAVVGTLISAALFYRLEPWTARLGFYGAAYNANEAATLVGGCLMLVLFHILPAARGRWWQAGWLLAALVLATGIVLTGSRMPLAAAVACTGLGFALRGQWRLLGLLAAASSLALGLLLVEGGHDRRAVERGDSYRLAIWQQFAARVAHRPWLGEGILTDDTTQVAAGDAGAASADHESPAQRVPCHCAVRRATGAGPAGCIARSRAAAGRRCGALWRAGLVACAAGRAAVYADRRRPFAACAAGYLVLFLAAGRGADGPPDGRPRPAFVDRLAGGRRSPRIAGRP